MARNAIEIVNRALVKIGAMPIQSFEDSSTEAILAKQLYRGVKEEVLCSHTWNFATRKTYLSPIQASGIHTINAQYTKASDTPYHSYALPADCIRITASTMEDYLLEDGVIFTPHTRPQITYVASVKESDFPAFFDSVLCAKLSAEIATP